MQLQQGLFEIAEGLFEISEKKKRRQGEQNAKVRVDGTSKECAHPRYLDGVAGAHVEIKRTRGDDNDAH